MRRATNCLAALSLGMTTLVTAPAWPCGAGFGQQVEVVPTQDLALAHTNGVETYVFRPQFCGAAAEFGLILPISGPLTSPPELAEKALFDQLQELTAPEVIETTVCRDTSDRTGTGGAGVGNWNGGVEVVQYGQVGVFDYALLQADSSAAFTDWLDANGFPYDSAAVTHFEHYVQQGWYFVAFKINASAAPLRPDGTLCGELGPVQLEFQSSDFVIPSRIAAVGAGSSSTFVWRVFALTEHQVATNTPFVSSVRNFAGAVTESDLAEHPLVDELADAGDYLTELSLTFHGINVTDDVRLTRSPSQDDYRRTTTRPRYVDCPDGTGGVLLATGGSGAGGSGGGAVDPISVGNAGEAPEALRAAPDRGNGGGCSLVVDRGPSSSLGWLAALLGLGLLRRRRVR